MLCLGFIHFLFFGCSILSQGYTGLLNLIEFLGSAIPLFLYNNQVFLYTIFLVWSSISGVYSARIELASNILVPNWARSYFCNVLMDHEHNTTKYDDDYDFIQLLSRLVLLEPFI